MTKEIEVWISDVEKMHKDLRLTDSNCYTVKALNIIKELNKTLESQKTLLRMRDKQLRLAVEAFESIDIERECLADEALPYCRAYAREALAAIKQGD